MEGVLVGSQDVAQDLSLLSQHEVTHVLNVAYGIPNAYPNVSKKCEHQVSQMSIENRLLSANWHSLVYTIRGVPLSVRRVHIIRGVPLSVRRVYTIRGVPLSVRV